MENFEDNLFQRLTQACSESKQAFAQFIGMSQARLQLLTLVARKGEISHADVSKQLSLDGATITRLVKQFEKEEVLSRRLDPQDNRYTLVSLTTAGQQLITKLNEEHSQFQTQLLIGISREEQESTFRLLERLRINIRNIHDKK